MSQTRKNHAEAVQAFAEFITERKSMPNLMVQEEFLEVKKNPNGEESRIGIGSSPVYETSFDSVGALYRKCVSEYGKCTSRIYHDRKNAPPLAVGWVFRKRVPYDDNPRKKYLREVWVTVHKKEPEVSTKHFYKEVTKRLP